MSQGPSPTLRQTTGVVRTRPPNARLGGDEAQAGVSIEGIPDHGLVLLRVERACAVGHGAAYLCLFCICDICKWRHGGPSLLHHQSVRQYLEEEDGRPEEGLLVGHVLLELRQLCLFGVVCVKTVIRPWDIQVSVCPLTAEITNRQGQARAEPQGGAGRVEQNMVKGLWEEAWGV